MLSLLVGTAPIVTAQVRLNSSDNQTFEVDEEIANESQTVKNMIEGAHAHAGTGCCCCCPAAQYTALMRRSSVPDYLNTSYSLSRAAVADTGTEDIIPLPNVPGKILAKVIEYCRFHVEANRLVDDKPAKSEDDVKQWDTEFVKVDQATLFDLILVREPPPCLCLLCSHLGVHRASKGGCSAS